jgi:hypothetical protein
MALNGSFREVAAALLTRARAMEQKAATAAGAGAGGAAVSNEEPPLPSSR